MTWPTGGAQSFTQHIKPRATATVYRGSDTYKIVVDGADNTKFTVTRKSAFGESPVERKDAFTLFSIVEFYIEKDMFDSGMTLSTYINTTWP